MTRDEMHQRAREAMVELTTLHRKGNNARAFARVILKEVVSKLQGTSKGPQLKYLNIDDLTTDLDSQTRAGIKRFMKQHAPPSEGLTPKTIQVWSLPGADCYGEPGEDREGNFVLTDQYARFLTPFILAQYNREVSCKQLYTSLAISSSTWSNVVSSLLNPDVMTSYGVVNWRGSVEYREDMTIHKPTHMAPANDQLQNLKTVIGENVWTILDEKKITDPVDLGSLGFFGE